MIIIIIINELKTNHANTSDDNNNGESNSANTKHGDVNTKNNLSIQPWGLVYSGVGGLPRIFFNHMLTHIQDLVYHSYDKATISISYAEFNNSTLWHKHRCYNQFLLWFVLLWLNWMAMVKPINRPFLFT